MAQSYTLHTDLDTLARRLTDGLGGALEDAIRTRLKAQSDAIVTQVAREMARTLHGKVHMCHDIAGQRTEVRLVLDGVSELVKP